MQEIISFAVDHTKLLPGIYYAGTAQGVSTYDLRMRMPNDGDYLDHSTMHSLEHLFAYYIRSGKIGGQIVYFGPMGCQTGCYLLTMPMQHAQVRQAVLDTLDQILAHDGPVPGASTRECGNYRTLSVQAAKAEAERYRGILLAGTWDFEYPTK